MKGDDRVEWEDILQAVVVEKGRAMRLMKLEGAAAAKPRNGSLGGMMALSGGLLRLGRGEAHAMSLQLGMEIFGRVAAGPAYRGDGPTRAAIRDFLFSGVFDGLRNETATTDKTTFNYLHREARDCQRINEGKTRNQNRLSSPNAAHPPQWSASSGITRPSSSGRPTSSSTSPTMGTGMPTSAGAT
jgi:hypothetical protein